MKRKIKLLMKIMFIIIVLIIVAIVIRNVVKIINSGKGDEIKGESAVEKYKDVEKISSYDNPIVPEGFKKIGTDTASWNLVDGKPKGWDNGLVIEDEQGNQFVWVPVKDERKYLSNYTVIDNYLYAAPGISCSEREIMQVLKYEGFYVSRYEAGLPNEISENTKEFSIETNNVEGVPVSKKDQIVWNFISWDNAKINAQNMYVNKKYKSDLISYSQWMDLVYWLDVGTTEDSGSYGNYSNVNFNFTGYYSTDYGKTYQYGKNKTKETYNMLLSTGAADRNKTNNIYDLAGNVSEFVDKYQYKDYKDKFHKVYYCMGGNYDNIGTYYNVGDENSISTPNSRQGFRIVLYLE